MSFLRFFARFSASNLALISEWGTAKRRFIKFVNSAKSPVTFLADCFGRLAIQIQRGIPVSGRFAPRWECGAVVCKSQIIVDDPPEYVRGEKMEFHLVYDGNLLRPQQSGNRRVWEKHAIRGFLSPQLKKLWETHPALKSYGDRMAEIDEHENPVRPPKPFLNHLADRHKVEDLRVIPITTEGNGLVCSLDILFLIPEPRIIESGDIDNRLKTLIDALKKPKTGQIQKKHGDAPDPNPMYCLMEDDKQITGLAIRTDRLLYPMEGGQHDAIAVIRVTTAQVDPFGSPWELHL